MSSVVAVHVYGQGMETVAEGSCYYLSGIGATLRDEIAEYIMSLRDDAYRKERSIVVQIYIGP